MATLDSLKHNLRETASPEASSSKQMLSDAQYSAGLDILLQGSGWNTYQDFIIPQLSQLLTPLFNSRRKISVLEIGPGSKSVLGYLPGNLRRKIMKYTAFEPNGLFATGLEEWFRPTSEKESPLPCLEKPPNIHRIPFLLQDDKWSGTETGASNSDEKYDIVLFCHSMYSMKPKQKFIEKALETLVEQPHGGMVVAFHRDGNLNLDDLVCYRRVSFPTGEVSVADDDNSLDCFASFVAGFTLQEVALRVKWRKVCRALGRYEEAHPDHLVFSSPDMMVAFNQHATMLQELTAQVPLAKGDRTVKNREARLHLPAAIVRPTEVKHVQKCAQWALKHEVGLTVVGGGHSGQCLWPNVVAIDMSAFDQVQIVSTEESRSDFKSGSLVVADTGCTTGDIVRKTMAVSLIVPLGARPSVGAGLWLQGGIGHLARLHGLASDVVVGAVIVSVDSGQILCVGRVPSQHWPVGAERPENETDLLWAMKGAGTNFGIVISIIFEAYVAPTYSVRNWVLPLSNSLEARLRLSDFDELVASKLPRNSSADAYLYCENDKLQLGVTVFESSTSQLASERPTPLPVRTIMGPEVSSRSVDSVGLFDTEMYISGMHGGHGGGKTSSFKRGVFLKGIGAMEIAGILVAAIETRPSPFCYLHLLQGGGAVSDVADDATAFGCRDWDFACVVTGVWPRDQDGNEAARAAVRWVYRVVEDLLPVSSGVYGADLGPDPRDAALAAVAFGPNRPRLARLKRSWDPRNVLAYACPLPRKTMEPKLIILITGEICAGKDFFASQCVSVLMHNSIKSRAISISEVTKREYAKAKGADLHRLLWDRAYKEQHRPALTAFFQDQVRQRPRLPQEHFLNVVYREADVDVLLITGMRDQAPVAAFSHLVPDSRLLEIRVTAKKETRQARGDKHGVINESVSGSRESDNEDNAGDSNLMALDYRPSLVFANDTTGDQASKRFAEQYLLPFLHADLQRLAQMVRPVPDFPCPGSDFRHILDIAQQPGGLNLCTSLLQSHFNGDWAKINAVVCCEAGGFVFASPLASRVDVPLVLVREAGKLPPPTVSVTKSSSYISSLITNGSKEKQVEMEQGIIPWGSSIVVVDDVLSTGETLRAVLRLLVTAGIGVEDISVIVVAEFPIHRGRELLRQSGYGGISIQSLLIFSVA